MHIDSFNVKLKTLGGKQFWTDIRNCGGWRIQRNAVTRHYRLIDPGNYRHCWGDQGKCEQFLEQKIAAGDAVFPAGRVVIVLHGLIRATASMCRLGRYLDEHSSMTAVDFEYASTRRPIAEHAQALKSVVNQLGKDVREINFVGHSMGNIVVRHLIGDLQRDEDPHRVLDRCRSMVMLGPPNQGAAIARRLAPTGLYGIVTGKGGLELGPEWGAFVGGLATPPFPFAIIAGDLSRSGIRNPLLDGSGDFVVSLQEARLEGAETFKTFPVLHSFLMNDQTVIEQTVKFIQDH